MTPSGMAGWAAAVLPRERGEALLLVGLLLAGTLLAGAIFIAVLSRWRRRADSGTLTPVDQLAQFRSLYEQGAISQEEFNRLRALLGGEVRQALGVVPRSQAPAQEQGTPGPVPQGPEPGPSTPPEPPPEGVRPA
jgi:hypothetical protein